MAGNYKDNADVFKALADENRLKILELLMSGEKCGSELLETISMSQSTLSHHLKIMCVSGIIKSNKKGTATYYSVNHSGAESAVSIMCQLLGVEISQKKCDATEEAPSTEAEPAREEKKTVRQTGSRPNGWLL